MKRKFVPGLVSLVVASYNHAYFLRQRMDSLLNQTYKKKEIIVIDDNSNDGSWAILKKYKKYKNITIIRRKKNAGWVYVSNQAAKISRGEFILFANCDDACKKEMVSQLVKPLKKNPKLGISFCRSILINENEKKLGNDFENRETKFKTFCKKDVTIPGHIMKRFLLHSCVIPNLSAALIRRISFFGVGGFKSHYLAVSDWELFFRVAETSDFAYVTRPLNYFRQHSNTIRSATKGRASLDEFLRLLLCEIKRSKMPFVDRLRFRARVMYFWVVDLLRPSSLGWLNFGHHLKLTFQLDAAAVLLLPFVFFLRLVELFYKMLKQLKKIII